jgi:hypothetical protein
LGEIAIAHGTSCRHTLGISAVSALWTNDGSAWSLLATVGFPDEATLHGLVEEARSCCGHPAETASAMRSFSSLGKPTVAGSDQAASRRSSTTQTPRRFRGCGGMTCRAR